MTKKKILQRRDEEHNLHADFVSYANTSMLIAMGLCKHTNVSLAEI